MRENNPVNKQLWYVDSGCSRHMTSERSNFLSLTTFDIGEIGESLSHSIDNVYLVDGLQHNLLRVSQLCDKNNLLVFSPKQCLVVNINIGDVVLRGKQHKSVYKVCI